jgi:hypothetical protein
MKHTLLIALVPLAITFHALETAAVAQCDSLDYDNDGNVSQLDARKYYSAFVQSFPCFGCGDLNFNNDFTSTGQPIIDHFDLEAYAARFAGGPCITEANTGSVYAPGCVGGDVDFNNDGLIYDPCDLFDWIYEFTLFPSVCSPLGQSYDVLDVNRDGAANVYDLITLTLGFADIPGCMLGTLPTGGPTCDPIDFNADGTSFDPTDIDAFLSVFSEGPCVPETATCNNIDFNNDGTLFDPCDIDSFLLVFSEGPCTLCGE